jgi:hypothetical protein
MRQPAVAALAAVVLLGFALLAWKGAFGYFSFDHCLSRERVGLYEASEIKDAALRCGIRFPRRPR